SYTLAGPAACVDPVHRIWTVARDHLSRPSGLTDRSVVVERVARLVRGREHLDVEPLEQRPRPELRRGKPFHDRVVDPPRGLAAEPLCDAEQLVQLVI